VDSSYPPISPCKRPHGRLALRAGRYISFCNFAPQHQKNIYIQQLHAEEAFASSFKLIPTADSPRSRRAPRSLALSLSHSLTRVASSSGSACCRLLHRLITAQHLPTHGSHGERNGSRARLHQGDLSHRRVLLRISPFPLAQCSAACSLLAVTPRLCRPGSLVSDMDFHLRHGVRKHLYAPPPPSVPRSMDGTGGLTFRCFSAGEVLGYMGRVMANSDPFDMTAFLIQICCLTFGPAFFAAGIYLCLSRMCALPPPPPPPPLSRLPLDPAADSFRQCLHLRRRHIPSPAHPLHPDLHQLRLCLARPPGRRRRHGQR